MAGGRLALLVMSLFGASLLSAGGCMSVAKMRVGRWVPAAELEAARDDLRGWISAEIRAGQVERAFYALEVMKTRPLASKRLAREEQGGSVVASDLRILFGELFKSQVDAANAPLVASRGLKRVDSSEGQALQTLDARGEAAFWRDLRLFQTRIDSFVPLGHALRHSFAASSSIEATGLLGGDGLGVSYFVHEDRVHLFVLGRGEIKLYELPKKASELRALSHQLLATLKRRPEGPHDQKWRAPAEALFHELFAPIQPLFDDGSLQSLYVVPDGFLANVPFGLLTRPTSRGKEMLLERMRVSYLPSFTLLRRQLMQQDRDEVPSMMAIGNPAFSVEVTRLPAAAREARVSSGVFEQGRFIGGALASESAVKASMEEHNILHFATHGVLMGDQLPGASSLLLAADERSDGFLSAGEIAGMDLSHLRLAVLSACETSVSTDGEASLDLGSLTGSFMVAGAPTVVGSLWKVSDDATTALLLSFYSAFLERGAGDALRAAQLAIRAQRGFEHPYYWGAFVVYGWDK